MSAGERAKWFYNQKLIPHLSVDVATAESGREKKNHRQVNQIFENWVAGDKDQKILTKLDKRVQGKKINLLAEEDLIKVGYAGLGRIQHVDINTQIKKEVRQKTFLVKKLEEVQKLYQRLGLETLIPWTIHQGSIQWIAEVAQDQATTQEVLGNSQESIKILTTATEKTFEIVTQTEKGVNLETPELVLQRADPAAFEQRKFFLGSLSAFGVLLARRAKITGNLPELTLGLSYVARADAHEPNPSRLSTIALWTIRGVLGKDYEGGLSIRARALTLASLSLIKASLEKKTA